MEKKARGTRDFRVAILPDIAANRLLVGRCNN
jgi:hypothetical protein